MMKSSHQSLPQEPMEPTTSSSSLKRKAASPLKELEVVTADDLGVATVEVIGADDTNKASRPKVLWQDIVIHGCIRLTKPGRPCETSQWELCALAAITTHLINKWHLILLVNLNLIPYSVFKAT